MLRCDGWGDALNFQREYKALSFQSRTNGCSFVHMDLIQKWLSGKRNFHVGAILYSQFGKDEKLKMLFQTAPDKYKQERLVKELSALAQTPKDILVARSQKGSGEEMPKSNDPVLQALRNEWLPVYQEMNYLRHELDRFHENSKETSAQRKPIAFKILSLEQQCMEIWARRDHYLDKGNLPVVKEDNDPLPSDPVELGRLIESTKRNIRRNKNLVKQYPDNVVYPLKLKVYQEKLDRIMKIINDEQKAAGK